MPIDIERPADWAYKAEGSANVAWQYCGGDAALLGRILRMAKRPRVVTQRCESGPSRIFPSDPLVYAANVMRPLLGTRHVIPGVRVAVSPAFISAMQARLAALPGSVRPARRRHDRLDDSISSVVVMLDHSVILRPSSTAPGAPAVTLCVEIKPKSGVPQSSTAAGASGSAPCRYCAHQVLKACDEAGVSPRALRGDATVASAVARHLSQYCPLDLYSGEPARVRAALGRLAASPQNNLRVFADGQLVFSAELIRGLHGGAGEGDLPASVTEAAGAAALDAFPVLPALGGAPPPLLPSLATLDAVLRAYEPFRSAALLPPIHPAMQSVACPALPPAVDALFSALAAVLAAEAALLARLRALQADDGGGLSAVWPLFARLVAQSREPADPPLPPPDAPEAAQVYADAAPAIEAQLLEATAAGDAASAAAADALRSFLVSTCAKDCSLLVAMQLRPLRDGVAEDGVVSPTERLSTSVDAFAPALGGLGELEADAAVTPERVAAVLPAPLPPVRVDYRLAVVDLDPKPLGRLPHWVAQEAAIQEAWAQGGAAVWRALGREGGGCRP